MSLIPNDLPTNGSDHTPNLNLPLFVRDENDKPSWFVDWNSTVETIDKNFGELQATANATVTVLENIKNTDDAQNTQIKDLQEITMTTSEGLQDLTVTVNDHTNKIDNIEQDLITQNTAVKQAQTDIAQLKTGSGTTATELDSLTNRVDTLENDVDSIKTSIGSLRENSYSLFSVFTNVHDVNDDDKTYQIYLPDHAPAAISIRVYGDETLNDTFVTGLTSGLTKNVTMRASNGEDVVPVQFTRNGRIIYIKTFSQTFAFQLMLEGVIATPI